MINEEMEEIKKEGGKVVGGQIINDKRRKKQTDRNKGSKGSEGRWMEVRD